MKLTKGAVAASGTAMVAATTLLLGAGAAHADQNVGYISYGDTGMGVKCVQMGVGVSADGIWGDRTEAAVERFQRNHGLAADGIVGPRTGDALMRGLENYYGWCYYVLPTSY